ncbi:MULTISPECIES: acetyl-CoA carboxylase biotin carboxyl carrier protein subunit [Bacillaceae]|uniref:Acetyl-CoA carboxylase biotin carboxyl carrier protein subunit n=1 Tax=Evansella alkalicola TaxID=745819 RepID=A0ABS6JQC4_9BACI|nr:MULTISPECIES: acetyl-CoA carboxylase biotin carboxyl carrier protein subunit [Bacillaceae]MBU9720756.1 acetyl-CoA carboxylase biotin carboxyl carrier protein subunit [Bacillus alkalicola]
MKEIKTNMAGNVWKIQVAQGDQVEVGQEVVILESMKMEIPITAEVGGTVKELKVEEGSFVNEDDVLLIVD